MARKPVQIKYPEHEPGISLSSKSSVELRAAVMGHWRSAHSNELLVFKLRGFNAIEGCNACAAINARLKKVEDGTPRKKVHR